MREVPFQFSAFPGRFGTPMFGAAVLAAMHALREGETLQIHRNGLGDESSFSITVVRRVFWHRTERGYQRANSLIEHLEYARTVLNDLRKVPSEAAK